MSKLLKLRKELVDFLISKPENGMGYHVVDITFKNGKVLKNRIVINSTYLQLTEKDKFDNNNITKIELSND